jgi:hypothetical protein
MTIATMSAALYANTNLDAEENNGVRERMLNEIAANMEERFDSTLAVIYGAKDPNAIDEVDMDDPFYAAMVLPEEVMAEMRGEDAS